MKRWFTLTAAALVALTANTVWAGGDCCSGHACHCTQPPEPQCPDCSDACCHSRLPALFDDEHAHKLIEILCSCADSGERAKAAKKLGSRIHANICNCPDIVEALVKAMTCDTCWVVRRDAAWALAMQDARVPLAVAGLYVASKCDRHFVVRDRAAEALLIVTRCRRDCYKDMFRAADILVARIKADYNPTKGNCVNLVLDLASTCDVTESAPVLGTPPPAAKVAEPAIMPKGAEPIAPPKEEEPKKEEMKKDEPKKEEAKEEKKEEEKKDESKDEKKEDKKEDK
jgi:hypothetical protein